MMAHAERAVDKPAAHAHNLDIGIMIGAVIADLFKTPEGRKIADGIGDHGSSCHGKPRGHARHSLLGNAGIDKLIRIGFPEGFQHAEPQVTGDQHEPPVVRRQTHQSPYKCISHGLCASSSRRAASYSSPCGVL